MSRDPAEGIETSPTRWRAVKDMLFAALEVPTARRDQFLAAACAGDRDLEARVAALLRDNHTAGHTLEDSVRLLERLLLLRAIDMMWVEHLTAAEELRQGIGLRALAQQDPLVVYKHEAHDMWTQFRERIRQVVTRQIFRTRLTTQAAQAAQQEQAPKQVVTSGPGEPGAEGTRPVAAAVSGGVTIPEPDENASRADRRRYERALQKAEKRKGKRG